MNIKELQDWHDRLVYPKCTFDVEDLCPTGALLTRFQSIEYDKLFSSIEMGTFKNLLDVGCNKGGFSFFVIDDIPVIHGIDPNKEMVQFANEVSNYHKLSLHVKFYNTTFLSFIPEQHYDLIYFGQSAHHIFKQAFRDNLYPLWFLDKAKKICNKSIVLDAKFIGDPSVDKDAEIDLWASFQCKQATIFGYAERLWPEFELKSYGLSGDGDTRYLAVFDKRVKV